VCPVSGTVAAPGPGPANTDKATSSAVVTYSVVAIPVVATPAPEHLTTIVSVSPANTTVKASGTVASPVTFKGGATAVAANLMAIVLAGVAAAAVML